MPCPTLPVFQHYGLTDGIDVQITSSTVKQSRSESVVAVNPTNPQNLICASKRFIDPGIDILHAPVAIDAVKEIRNRGAARAVASLREIILNVAKEEMSG